MVNKRIKTAVIKYLGLCAGGTEKFLQTIACGLPKDEFEVDFYYSHPEDNPPVESIKQHLIDSNVNLIEFKTSKPRVHRGKIWLDDTNFFEVFKNDYDLIQTGRCGLYEEPFCSIRNIPVVDSMHYVVGVDNQYNISRTMHISEFSKRKWIDAGGDKDRIVMVSHPMIIPEVPFRDFRQELGLEGKFIFGFHQRNDNAIFSDIPLKAFKEITDESNAFVILGGGEGYKQQAKESGLNNVYFLEHTADKEVIYNFLKMLNIYAHGRRDGELNSTAIAEALHYGKPVVSHLSQDFNGHVECIGNAGFILNNSSEYAQKLREFQTNSDLYNNLSQNALKRFDEMYDYENQMRNITEIYKDVVKNPYPNKLKRLYLDIKQQFPLRKHRRWK